ncbi:MAG: penicillin-binding protein [Gemmatimonadales bacterium]
MARQSARLRVLEIAFAVALLVVLGRAAHVQLIEGARYAARAREQRTERVTLPARRGAIYDRNGVPLALTQEAYHVDIAANELCSPGSAKCDFDQRVREIARHIGVPEREFRRALADGYAYFHGPFSSAQVQPLRRTRGVHLTSELMRLHPDPDFARAVLGRPAAPGLPASGIERVLDTLLSGVDGSAVVLRDRQGRRYESPSRLDQFPVPGKDVYLTLDVELQEIVEEALAAAIDRFGAMAGDIVVLDPRTGELLAVASLDRDGTSSAGAFTEVFEPGSSGKIFAAAALLAAGLASPSDTIWAEQGEYRLGERTIHDNHPSGWLTLEDVIAQSSNIGIVKFARVLTHESQYSMLRDFGLGTPVGVEFPAESPGILKLPDQWSGTTAASLAIGYELAVTPIQLAQAYAAIANDGVLLRPTLVREIRSAAGDMVYRHRPEPVRRAVSAAVAAQLRAMLREVVYGSGTGSTAALTSYEVAGKTGTARRAGPGGYIPGSYTASFASLFPADDPQLAMVVKLDDPDYAYARLTAAPLTRVVLERLLAARSGALDRARLSRARVPGGTRAAVGAGSVPYVIRWPRPMDTLPGGMSAVPDVVGLTLRRAVRRLHQAGLHVRVRGWGRVGSVEPPAGTELAPGALVTIVGVDEVPSP